MAETEAVEGGAHSSLIPHQGGVADSTDCGQQLEGSDPQLLTSNDFIDSTPIGPKRFKPRNETRKRKWLWRPIFLAFILFLASFTVSHLLSVYMIQGSSMNPTIDNGDFVILKKASTLTRGNIVVFTPPKNWNREGSESIFIKRVVAVSGDSFEYKDRSFLVNDKVTQTLPQNYLCSKGVNGFKVTLKKDEFIAFGDNVNNSFDSKYEFCQGRTKEFIIPTSQVLSTGPILIKSW